MQFEIGTADTLKVTDAELSQLLTQVYVEGGFTKSKQAKILFEPQAVRQRGILIAAREKCTAKFAGMIVLVSPESTACRLAQHDEAEIHLLGVHDDFRGHGLGKSLVTKTLVLAKQKGYSKMLLWTQESMTSAHKLYESSGFSYTKNLYKNGHTFWVYERKL